MSFSPRVKGAVPGLATNAGLLVTTRPEDTDGFHLQDEMNQVGARMKQILGEVRKKE